MNMTAGCREKIDDFINKIISMNYCVESVSRKPQLYRINNKLVNIRCTTMDKDPFEGSRFWYSINLNVLKEAEWFIYLMTTSDYFVMFPREFLKRYQCQMYPDHSKPNTVVFEIDWGSLSIVLKNGSEDINVYYHNLIDKDDYPRFEG